jgi:hypothetical protein
LPTRIIAGKLSGLFISTQSDTLESGPISTATVTLEGIVGDKHSGFTRAADGRTPFKRGTIIRNQRQISILSVEDLEDIRTAMGIPELKPEWVGANLITQDIPDLTLIPAGTRLVFPDNTVLIVEEENFPCKDPGEVIQSHFPHIAGLTSRFPKAAMHKRGVVATVEQAGTIRLGDPIEVRLRIVEPYPLLLKEQA